MRTERESRTPKEVSYQLVDFGDGRKLEALGEYRVERPSPAAVDASRRDRGWQATDATFRRTRGDNGRWQFRTPWPEPCWVRWGAFVLESRPTPFGHLGFFPEQAANWRWIESQMRLRQQPRVLNLFAYTGGSTLAAAIAGASVTHVDAARPNVEAAKSNAVASGLGEAPIRFIVEDARKYVGREIRRRRSYNLVILDPPAYGHGVRGKAWRLSRDVWPLLDDCRQLLEPGGQILLTGHSPDVGPREVRRWLGRQPERVALESGRLGVRDLSDRQLDAGFYCRMTWDASSP